MKLYRPRGFTLVELLVVITIIGILMALLVPAVGAAREAARRAQCSSNMGEVATAIQVYESTKGELPGRVNAISARKGNATAVTAASWITAVLPQLDRNDIYDLVRSGEINTATAPRLDIIICPSDPQVSGSIAALSFVANSGYWDVDNTQYFDFQENGLFFGKLTAQGGFERGPTMRIESIKDGAATTLLVSENVQAGPPEGADSPTWFLSPTEQSDGFVWVNDPNPSDNAQARINRGKDISPPPQNTPQFCRPSSNHPDGVNVAFADGHVQFLRDNIEYRVYQQLMTSYGGKARIPDGTPNGTLAHPELRGSTNLLNAKDYQ